MKLPLQSAKPKCQILKLIKKYPANNRQVPEGRAGDISGDRFTARRRGPSKNKYLFLTRFPGRIKSCVAFIRSFDYRGRKTYGLVDYQFRDGRSIQTVLAQMGTHPDFPSAIAGLPDDIADLHREAADLQRWANEIRECAHPNHKGWQAEAERTARRAERRRVKAQRFRESLEVMEEFAAAHPDFLTGATRTTGRRQRRKASV